MSKGQRPADRSGNRVREPRDGRKRPDAAPTGTANCVYGVVPVLEALRSNNRRIERILVAEGVKPHRLSDLFDLARRSNVLIETVARDRIERLTGGDVNHQGVIAMTSAAEYVDADLILERCGDPALFVLLDGVEDPRNLGAILRTAECAGVDGVFIPERRAVGLTESAARSSAGAVEYIKVAKITNLNRFIEELKSRNVWVVGACGDAAVSYTDWDWTAPTALVLGAEGSGLHRLVAENCDALVKIPMYGRIDSLNVSVAAGVLLFEAQRQREQKK